MVPLLGTVNCTTIESGIIKYQGLKRTNTAVKKNLGLGLDVAADDDACPILAGYWHELKVGAGVSISVQKPYSCLPKDIPPPQRYAKMYFSHTLFCFIFAILHLFLPFIYKFSFIFCLSSSFLLFLHIFFFIHYPFSHFSPQMPLR